MFSIDDIHMTQLSLDAFTDTAESIGARCAQELVGHPPMVQATALLDLHSTFLSGFNSLEARREVLDMHMRSVLRLAQIKFDERSHANGKTS